MKQWEMNAGNIIGRMIEKEEQWIIIDKYIGKFLKEKKKEDKIMGGFESTMISCFRLNVRRTATLKIEGF